MPAIKPSEVVKYKKRENVIPEYVLDAFNYLIAENFDGKSSQFTRDAVIEEILKRSPEEVTKVTREYIFGNRFLDIEDIYQDAGWSVCFDSPTYSDSYLANFQFRKK